MEDDTAYLDIFFCDSFIHLFGLDETETKLGRPNQTEANQNLFKNSDSINTYILTE